jgi:hypothetical protein
MMSQRETAVSEKEKEPKTQPPDWSYLVMKNSPPGVREKTLKYFRDNPVSVTIRPARELRPDSKPRKEDEQGAPERIYVHLHISTVSKPVA